MTIEKKLAKNRVDESNNNIPHNLRCHFYSVEIYLFRHVAILSTLSLTKRWKFFIRLSQVRVINAFIIIFDLLNSSIVVMSVSPAPHSRLLVSYSVFACRRSQSVSCYAQTDNTISWCFAGVRMNHRFIGQHTTHSFRQPMPNHLHVHEMP